MDEIDGMIEDKSPINLGVPENDKITPENALIVNPFESIATDTLHLPQFSPSVFSKTTSPSRKRNTGSPFEWSIDNIAILNPADIDETSHQDSVYPDGEVEEKAQSAIDKFFSQKHVVPSPWSEPAAIKHVTFSPNPPSTRYYDGNSSMYSPVSSPVSVKARTADVSCQTVLSLPVDFDLQAVLGGEFYQESEMDETCMSTLRRKLFFQGDCQSVPSPVKGATNRKMTGREVRSPPLSPASRPKHGSISSDDSPVKTPSSNQFSSSPIQEKLTPLKPTRSSILSVAMDTPSLSPIARPILKTPSTGSSGDSVRFAVPMTPSTYPTEGTPSTTDRLERLLNFASPGLSPIKTVGREAQKCSADNHETPQKTSLLYSRDKNRRSHNNLSGEFHDNKDTNPGRTESLSPLHCGGHLEKSAERKEDLTSNQNKQEDEAGCFIVADSDCVLERDCRVVGSVTSETSTQMESNAQIDSGVNMMQSMDVEFTNCESAEGYPAYTAGKIMSHRTSARRSLSTDTDTSMDSNIDIDMSVIQADRHRKVSDTASEGLRLPEPWQNVGGTYPQENAVIQQMTDVFATSAKFDQFQTERLNHGQHGTTAQEHPSQLVSTVHTGAHCSGLHSQTPVAASPMHVAASSPSLWQSTHQHIPCGKGFYNYIANSHTLSRPTVPRIINQNSTGAPQFLWQCPSSHPS